MPTRTDSLQFWFDMGSNYSYLSMMRIEALAQAARARIVLKPFLLGPIFKSFGWNSSPFVLQQLKGDYTWRDMERQCAKYGIAWRKPGVFPRRALLPMRLAVAAADQPWLLAFCRQVMQRNFAHDAEIDDAGLVASVLNELGLDAPAWIARARSDKAREQLRANTGEALRRGVFGAPMFFIGDEKYWGNDRLEDALADFIALGSDQPPDASELTHD